MEASLDERVRAAQAGDSRAFAALIERYERTALAVAYAVLGEAHLAGDVVQEAFLRAWRKLDTLKEPGSVGSWLVNIVRNLAADERRRLVRRRSDELHPGVADRAAGPDLALQNAEDASSVAAALERLDEVSRLAVVLRYYEDLSSRQIGVLLELSPAAVDMRLSRARQELRGWLMPMAHGGAARPAAACASPSPKNGRESVGE